MTLRAVVIILLMVAALGAAGCGNLNKVPRYDLDAAGAVAPFKRYAKYDERDFINRARAEAYYPRTGEVDGPLSESARGALERHGSPDYVRYRFKSTTNELVDQWAWWDRRTTAQFVNGELVFEGPLTEMDQYMIRHGYPQKAMSQDYTLGVRRDYWTYSGLFQAPLKHVTFTGEKLISEINY
ncbi:MAG: hypothetical protein SF028_14265 [Candidatus Sumerlaeia bacterium]|nr:hypothetical protein [Candidatus Sumerlaeia bacterium]